MGVRLSVADLLTLFSVAVTLTFCAVVTVPVVAENVALVWFAGTVTLLGTATPVPLLRDTTVEPLDEPVKVTVQVLVALLVSEVGLQDSADNWGWLTGSEIVPDPPLAVIEDPPAVDATTPVRPIVIVGLDGFAASWKLATATVPSGITVLFRPKTRQVDAEQLTDFPALVAEPPATTVTPITSDP